jgi:hypothetical protein
VAIPTTLKPSTSSPSSSGCARRSATRGPAVRELQSVAQVMHLRPAETCDCNLRDCNGLVERCAAQPRAGSGRDARPGGRLVTSSRFPDGTDGTLGREVCSPAARRGRVGTRGREVGAQPRVPGRVGTRGRECGTKRSACVADSCIPIGGRYDPSGYLQVTSSRSLELCSKTLLSRPSSPETLFVPARIPNAHESDQQGRAGAIRFAANAYAR